MWRPCQVAHTLLSLLFQGTHVSFLPPWILTCTYIHTQIKIKSQPLRVRMVHSRLCFVAVGYFSGRMRFKVRVSQDKVFLIKGKLGKTLRDHVSRVGHKFLP